MTKTIDTTDRVTAYAIQPTGARSFGVEVRGLRILVTADEGQHDEGRAMAEAIAAMGPEATQAEPERPVAVPVAAPAPTPRTTFTVGQRVWCQVHGAEGFCTVTQVGEGRNRGRIKITGERCWCPAGNFLPEEQAP